MGADNNKNEKDNLSSKSRTYTKSSVIDGNLDAYNEEINRVNASFQLSMLKNSFRFQSQPINSDPIFQWLTSKGEENIYITNYEKSLQLFKIAHIRAGELNDSKLISDALTRMAVVHVIGYDNINEAQKLLNKAIEKDDGNGHAWFNSGIILMIQGKKNKSIKSFDKALEADESYSKFYKIDALVFKANTMNQKQFKTMNQHVKNENKVNELYEQALECEPLTSDSWLARGIAMMRLYRTKGILRPFEKAIELNPNNAVAWNHKGIVLLDSEKPWEAVKAFNQALKINPSAVSWYRRGEALFQIGEMEESLKSYNNEPNDIQCRWRASEIYKELKRYNESLNSYEKLLSLIMQEPKENSISPGLYNLADVYQNLARLSARTGNVQKAITYLTKFPSVPHVQPINEEIQNEEYDYIRDDKKFKKFISGIDL